jgi:GNAT superfamily N-acetyltransferase
MLHSDGPSPRFGSCYLLLEPEVSQRCTFTYLDSHRQPPQRGTHQELDDILAALLSDVFSYGCALGARNLSVPQLLRHLTANLPRSACVARNLTPARALDQYIEAQVHGEVRLDRDVELLVADPSFQGTAIGESLQQIATTYRFALRWHAGFSLPLDRVPSDFRGPTMPSLARHIATGNDLDASMIGPAVMELRRNPQAWSDRGGSLQVLQELKLLWHVLVKYGQPVTAVAALHIRAAQLHEIPLIEDLIARSIRTLGADDYTPAQIEAALRGAFGVDTQLIHDGTYFVVERGGQLVACGGWSYRGTLFGSDAREQRDAGRLDPTQHAARIRAFFVDPQCPRQGIGTALLDHCEAAARAHGFTRCELMATLPGVRLYEARGYVRQGALLHALEPGLNIEFVPMCKALADDAGFEPRTTYTAR